LPQSSSVDLSSLQVADLDELRVTANLGQGASGVVQRVLHTPSQVELALKVVNVPLDQNEKAIKHLITELKTLHLSVCPQIVSFHGAFFRDAAIYLCLEYMDFGSLADLLKRVDTVPERYLAHISRQVLQGLSYLHQERRIIHRDIKPSKSASFRFSGFCLSVLLRTFCC
jgi:mitogen-activated protein kinase kinase 1